MSVQQASSQNANRIGLHRIYKIFIFPEFPILDHALIKPASTLHNKKILLILNILLILYY